MEKIAVYFEKYANFERKGEPCSIAVPFPEGELWKTDSVVIRNKDDRAFPTQPRITAKWPDGSIKWLYNVEISHMCTEELSFYGRSGGVR